MISVTIQSPDFELGADWDDLVSRAHPNVFMSPAALRAADVTMFATVHVMQAWDDSAQPRRLVGLWAMQRRRIWPFGTVILDALPFEYAFLSSPVIDPAMAGAVMSAFVKAIADTRHMPRVVLMKSLDTEAVSYRPLIEAIAAQRGRALTVKTESRPVIWRGQQQHATGERRKKLRQGWKRMSALGMTTMVFASEPDAVVAAVETFLELELKSWKGAAGTALLCRDEDATFVRRMISDMAQQGHAAVQSLEIDGKTVATQVLLFSGKMAYTWKTAFDQAYAKFSPGVVLIDKVTDHLFASTDIVGIDSCSAESGFMSQMWSGRRAMADVIVSVGPGPSFGFWAEAARQAARERLKQLRDRGVAWRAGRRARPVAPAETAGAPRAIATIDADHAPSLAVRPANLIPEASALPLVRHRPAAARTDRGRAAMAARSDA